MEGVGDEVFYFGLGAILSAVLLYKAVLYLFTSLGVPSEQQLAAEAGRTRATTYDCAICLGQAEFAVETNCGHVYCGDCLLEVWRRSNALSALSCPYCRQRVTIILPYFSQDERDSAEPGDAEVRTRVLGELSTYNRRHSGEPRTLLEQLRDLPVLLRHLGTYLASGEGLNLAFQLRVMILCVVWLLYLVSPVDLLPEAVFGVVGLIDDLLVFVLVAMYVTFFFRQVMANMAEREIPGINQ